MRHSSFSSLLNSLNIDACGEIEVMYEVDGQQTDECYIDRNEVIEAFYTALESDVVLQIWANTKLQ